MKSSAMVRRAFTLIELLVVMAVIGVLASLTVFSFTKAQKQARDARRQSDLKQYQNALEVYANSQIDGKYPDTSGTATAINSTLCSTLEFPACPMDVHNTGSKRYMYLSDETNYILYGGLEVPTSPLTYVYFCGSGKNGTLEDAPDLSVCN